MSWNLCFASTSKQRWKEPLQIKDFKYTPRFTDSSTHWNRGRAGEVAVTLLKLPHASAGTDVLVFLPFPHRKGPVCFRSDLAMVALLGTQSMRCQRITKFQPFGRMQRQKVPGLPAMLQVYPAAHMSAGQSWGRHLDSVADCIVSR